jgi:predicted Zn-dependent protease
MIKSRLSKIGIISLGCLFLTSCATVGRKEYLDVSNSQNQILSIENEEKFGRYVDAYIRNEFAVLENFAFQPELEEVFYKIVKNCDRDNLGFILRVISSKEINAFAGPGGYVYITTSLLDMIKNKDELVAVLAHEIGHICAQHSIKQFYATQRTGTVLDAFSFLAQLGSLAYTGDTGLGNTASTLVNFVAVISIQGYSRQDELQADSLATKYTTKAGYNPLTMIELLKRMEEEAKKKEKKSAFILLNSHPPLEVRIENITKQAEYLKGVKGGVKDD